MRSAKSELLLEQLRIVLQRPTREFSLQGGTVASQSFLGQYLDSTKEDSQGLVDCCRRCRVPVPRGTVPCGRLTGQKILTTKSRVLVVVCGGEE